MIAFLIVLLVVAALYFLSLRTGRGRREELRPFTETYIAHRGLHTNPVVPENSLSAFQRAVEAGFGIELDVQLTADDQLVIFHDETLERVCGDRRKLHELTLSELSGLRLFGTDERIPLFRDALDRIGGRVPLLVEIKSEGRYRRTTELTCEVLRSYDGIFCVESFHPLVLKDFRLLSPDTALGQLSTNYTKEQVAQSALKRQLLTNLMLNCLSRPDFIAYDRKYAKQFSFRLCRLVYRPVCFAWTVKSREQLEAARGDFDAFIFEGFDPRQTSDI